MPHTPYPQFFTELTGNPPFPFQAALASGPWPEVVDVPTGLGKTAAAVVAWLYRRLHSEPSTGRRLIYCLPMRVLVEQTASEASRWCEAAAPAFAAAGLEPPTVHVLMGGDVDEAWEERPASDAILIGTQDMLVSRALNRGYAMSRFRWPMHFGLLNNDCLWVLDETQLMGVAVETSAQLQAFRDQHGAIGPAHTLWMSATVGQAQLDTVDHPQPEAGFRVHALAPADFDHPMVRQRVSSQKPLEQHPLRLAGAKGDTHAAALAASAAAIHRERGGLTLMVVNRVQRAQAIYQTLRDKEGFAPADVMLVHSRFRPAERQALTELLLQGGGERLIVATQAVEAGVDIDANTLITELAPWPSLVQRFGRCNRRGTRESAKVLWIDIDDDPALALPYAPEELSAARTRLEALTDVGPATLREVAYQPPAVVRPILRRRDLLELFDTTADLCGDDLDVSRWVRDPGDTDTQFFWSRYDDMPGKVAPTRESLCNVSLGQARTFIEALAKTRKKLTRGTAAEVAHRVWRYNALDGAWEQASRARPGGVYLLHPDAGGYHRELGFVGHESREPVPEVSTSDAEGYGENPSSQFAQGRWVQLEHHLMHVEQEAKHLSAAFTGLAEGHATAVVVAGLWHDVGKAHEQFQRRLVDPVAGDATKAAPGEGPWAKSGHNQRARDVRPYFRHELASALAWLQAAAPGPEAWRNLVAFLIAAHHGKIRMSIRSMPGEITPAEAGKLFARGVWQGDELPRVALGDNRFSPELALDLTPMQMGQESWLSRAIRLRDDPALGPFRLAFLETLVRIADWRASANEQQGSYDDA